MASIIMDITTRGFPDVIRNVKGARNLVTAGTAVRMMEWYNQHAKRTMLDIIKSGDGIANNYGRYALEKEARYGISHGLGVLTGGLYFAVSTTQPAIKETRGQEVRFAVKFDDPYYIAYVVEGTSKAPTPRDFITLARDKEWSKLLNSLGSMFDGLDFTLPYPELMKSVIGPSLAPSLRSYG